MPNLLSATAIDHRIAAQYGQNSAPMQSISGFPFCVSGAPVFLRIHAESAYPEEQLGRIGSRRLRVPLNGVAAPLKLG